MATTTTREMRKCIKSLKKNARRGDAVVRMTLHQDTINELTTQGFYIEDDPRIPMDPDKREWKNPVNILVDLTYAENGSDAEKIKRICKKAWWRQAKKNRKIRRKIARKTFGLDIQSKDECWNCIYQDVCEDFSGNRCDGFVEDVANG